MITNAFGWGLAKDGNYYPPHVDVDGQWVLREDIEWEPDPPVVLPTIEPLQDYHLPTDTEIVEGDLKLTLTEPWRLDEKGHVWVRVMATRISTGQLLDVHDGVFHFVNAHAAIDLQQHLLYLCHNMTGIN